MVIIGWIVSITTIFSIIFGPYNIQNPDRDENFLSVAFWNAFARPVWGLCLSWIIFACVKGYGGFINSFLSHVFWQPLARLSYSLYLIHLIVMLKMKSSSKETIFFSDYTAVSRLNGIKIFIN